MVGQPASSGPTVTLCGDDNYNCINLDQQFITQAGDSVDSSEDTDQKATKDSDSQDKTGFSDQ